MTHNKKMKNRKKMLVTSALPYANGSLHIGHLVEYTQTDIFVRFHRLLDKDIIYCCGDDTHGTPIEIKAKDQGISPEELIAKYHKEHIEDFNSFLISFDNYYSTNTPENKHYSDLIFNRLLQKGFIYKKTISQTYCKKCERFLPDRYVRGKCPKCGAEDQYGDICEKCNITYKTTDLINPKCAVCKTPATQKDSLHYFFKLSAFSKKLSDWIKNKKFQPEVENYIQNWIKEGLEDWDITRDGPYFGFKIPGEENKYYYVWLDAPIGYIASTANYCKKHGLNVEEDYWQNKDTQIIHFISKDIIYFHFLFWPAMLDAADFDLPSNIIVHGFLTVEGEKMSKSRGTFLTAKDFLNKYENPEYLRFYYANLLSQKLSDINLDFDDFRERINTELIGNIGNFCHRVITFTNKNFDSKIGEIDKEIIEKIRKEYKEVEKSYNSVNFRDALKLILRISSFGNRYFQDNQPWKLIKEDKERVKKIMGTCINIVKDISILIAPILPNSSQNIQRQLNLENLKWKDLYSDLENHEIGRADIVIKKIEKEKSEKIKEKTIKECKSVYDGKKS